MISSDLPGAEGIDPKLYALDPATAWAEAVEAGKIVQGPHVRAAARRHLRDIERGATRGLKWDVDAGLHAIGWFAKYLRLNGGRFEGAPFVLHPSQAFRLASLFGWKMENGERRFRKFYDEEGKGNGKSPFLAGLGLYLMVARGRPRAEIYAAAAKRDQAMILFRDAVAMRDLSPELAARVDKLGLNPTHALVYNGRRGDRRVFKAISSDDTQSGPRPYAALCDEVHEHRNRAVIEMQARGLAKQPANSLLAMATNSGHDRNTICWDEHVHAIKAAAGADDSAALDRTFAFVCALDEGDDWRIDESCWAKTNPLLDVTIASDDLRETVAQAKAIPGSAANIARLHFCEWTQAHTIWIPMSRIEACEDPDFDPEEMRGRRMWSALDLSMTRDMTARANIWEDGETADGRPKFALWLHGYLPRETLADREREDDAPYFAWAEAGHITATAGHKVDYDLVAGDILRDAGRHDFQMLAYDAHLAAFFTEALENQGGDRLPRLEHPQGWSRRQSSPLYMPDSIAVFEQLILEQRIRIAVNPAFRSAMMSVAFRHSPAGLRRFDKASATARIDMAVTAAMAAGVAASAAAEKTPLSPWEEENYRIAV
jgi:phage terminase large subunit-like protein